MWQFQAFGVQMMVACRGTAPDRRTAIFAVADERMTQEGKVQPDLVLHLQETFSDVVKTDKTGLSKTAHTRWMISAFANFLPGSTIFRLA